MRSAALLIASYSVSLLTLTGIGSSALADESAPAGQAPKIQAAEKVAADQGEAVLAKHYAEVAPGTLVAVRGAKERRQVRFANWVNNLSGDKAAVYAYEGYPRHRLRENWAGRVTERWTYPESRNVYYFQDGVLVRTSRFSAYNPVPLRP